MPIKKIRPYGMGGPRVIPSIGLDEIICEQTSLPVSVAHNALFSVAEGTRLILDDFNYYQDILIRR